MRIAPGSAGDGLVALGAALTRHVEVALVHG